MRALIAVPLAVVCLSCGSGVDHIPVATTNYTRYAGTGPDDIWNVGLTMNGGGASEILHWDGSAWGTIELSSLVQVGIGPVAGAHSIFLTRMVGGNPTTWNLYTLDADGTIEDVALPPLPDPPFDARPMIDLYGGSAGVVAAVNGFGPDPDGNGGEILSPVRMYRRTGDTWTELPDLPDDFIDVSARVGWDGEVVIRVIQTWADGDYGYYPSCDGMNEPRTDGVTTPFLRLQGDSWEPMPGEACFEQPFERWFDIANPSFPIDDLWSDQWHYDGSTVEAPFAPFPPTNTRVYTYADGATVRFSEQMKGGADPGEAWSCDDFGYCTQVDTFAYAGTEWVAETWDGAEWTHRRKVAKGQMCVGAGCIYQGDVQGFVGVLEDGTVLIQQSGEPGSGEQPTLALVKP